MDATTVQNGLATARAFIEAVSCDGVFLAKLDGTAKGGVVFAIGKELGLPVAFIGTGEGLEDVSPFDPKLFVESLFVAWLLAEADALLAEMGALNEEAEALLAEAQELVDAAEASTDIMADARMDDLLIVADIQREECQRVGR